MRHPTGPTAAADTAGNFARLSQRAANRPRFDINANGEFVNANIEVTQGSYSRSRWRAPRTAGATPCTSEVC